MESIREDAVKRSQHWWFCENVMNHPGQVGLLRMDFPRVFILIRDYSVAYWAGYEEWKGDIIEVNFFTPSERDEADMDAILTDAWNFLALVEEEDERQYMESIIDENS